MSELKRVGRGKPLAYSTNQKPELKIALSCNAINIRKAYCNRRIGRAYIAEGNDNSMMKRLD
jgi:hypothetical protein